MTERYAPRPAVPSPRRIRGVLSPYRERGKSALAAPPYQRAPKSQLRLERMIRKCVSNGSNGSPSAST